MTPPIVMDANYTKKLVGLSRIRDVCGTQLQLPQLCVVGDQTSGKSSLLQTLTDVSFPVKSGICTRVPIVVHSVNNASSKCEIRVNHNESYREVQPDRLGKEIEAAQKNLLRDGLGKIVRTELSVRVSGPNQLDIIIVDLPGIIHHGDGENETRILIENYINNDQTLILLVSEAKQDHELITALSIAKKYDPNGERTLRCLSKFDTFDSDESRLTAIRLVENGLNDELGPHAVICRPGGNAEYDAGEEDEAFSSSSVPRNGRSGVESLRARLPSIFSKLVQTNLPMLANDAKKTRSDCKKELSRLGDVAMSPECMVSECQRVLSLPEHNTAEKVTPFIEQFREKMHLSQDRITREWVNNKMKPNAFECPFFYGDSTHQKCMIQMTKDCETPAEYMLNQISATLESSLVPISLEAVGVSRRLFTMLESKFKEKRIDIRTAVKEAVLASIHKAARFGTINHYLYDKYIEEVVLPDDMIDEIADHLFSQPARYKEQISEKIRAIRQNMILKEEKSTVHEHSVKRAFYAVKATWAVEKKNIVDAVLKDVRDHVLLPVREWVTSEILVDEEIRSAAVEDGDVAEKRCSLQERIAAMDKVLKEIELLSEDNVSESEVEAFESIATSSGSSYGF